MNGGIKKLFEPGSIAMVGVSSEPTKMSHWLIRNMAQAGFEGAVYPISRRGGENLGYKVYADLSELPEPVDLVLISVASKFVKATIQEAARNKAGAAVISLAGDFRVARAAFAQAGALVAETTEDFLDYLFALAYNRRQLPENEKLAIVTISDGPCVAASDYCEEIGLKVPKLGEGTREKLREYIPYFAADSNPVDMTVGIPLENIGPCVDTVMSDPDISGVIAINWGWDVKEFADAFVHGSKRHKKPVLAFASENPMVQDIFRQGGIVNFPAPERAVKAYWGLPQYGKVMNK